MDDDEPLMRAGSATHDPHQSPYRPLVTVLMAAVAGVLFSRYGCASASSAWFVLLWSLAAACVFAWRLALGRWHKNVAALLLLAGVALASAAWHDLRWNRFPRQEIARFASIDAGPACVEVIARETPDRLPAPAPTPLRAIPAVERSRLFVGAVAIRDGATWRPAHGHCQLTIDGEATAVRVGDRLRVFGRLALAAPPRNPGEFDFAAHARADRRLAMLSSAAPEAVTVIERSGGWGLQSLLEWVRGAGRRLIERDIGAERAALGSAILLGARGGMTSDEMASYLVTGTIHLLVVSGLHVAILAMGLVGAMRLGWLPRRTGLVVVTAVVWAYTLVAESQPPVVRAAVLTTLLSMAAWSGRGNIGFNSLAAAALVVLALNPADLFRVGPQLSFLAVATLIWLSGLASERRPQRDRLEQMLAATRPRFVRIAAGVWRWNRWLLTATLAVWMTALPLVLFHFHVVTPVALLIAPAVWVFVLAALWSGYAMLLVGWLLPPLGAALGALCNSSLAGLEAVVHWAESLPAGHFWAPGPAWWWVTVFYAGVVAAILWGRRIAPARWQVAALSAWIVIGIIPPLYRSLGRDSLECSFIAIGHGTCVLLEAPNGDTLLYDAGAIASPEFATRTISAYLWHRGIMRIDGIVLSHADIDHFNAVPGLLERFHIGAVYVSPMMFDGFDAKPQANLAPWRPDPAFAPDVLREALERAGVPIHVVWAGDRLRLGTDVTIDVLHPPRVGVLGSDNANSITLAVEAAGRRVLLTGDLESPGLEDVIAERPLDCDVLLAPHHGSRRSDPPGFAAWSTPEWVVISGGEADVAPVVQTYEAAGAIVAQTRQLGTVTFSIGRDELAAAAWRDGDRRLSGDQR